MFENSENSKSFEGSVGNNNSSFNNESEKTVSDEMFNMSKQNLTNDDDGLNDEEKNLYDTNYGLGYLDSYIKLKQHAKNIPTFKLLNMLEKESGIIKNLQYDSKKNRRMLEARIVDTDNKCTTNCQDFILKVYGDIRNFEKDMREVIKTNMEVTTKVSKEVYDLTCSMRHSKKDAKLLESLLTETENIVGKIDY